MRDADFLTVAEVAAKVRLTPRMIQKCCNDGSLEAVRFGRTYRIPIAAYEAWRKQLKLERPKLDIGKTFDVELAGLVQAWLWEMEHGPKPYAKDTIRSHRMHMHKYVKTLVGADPEARLTYQQAIGEHPLRLALARIPVAQFATRYNVYMAVMCFSNFLIRQGLVKPDVKVAMNVHKPKRLVPPVRRSLPSADVVNRFIEAIWQTEAYSTYEKHLNATIVATMVFAGLRVSEVANLELKDVDLTGRIITVENEKGGKRRYVGLNARLAGMITEYLAYRPGTASDRLFVSTRGGELCRDYIIRRIGRLSKRTGIEISAHGLRRTFATLNADAGHSINHIQLALGHKSLETTQKYLMADGRAAARAMQNW